MLLTTVLRNWSCKTPEGSVNLGVSPLLKLTAVGRQGSILELILFSIYIRPSLINVFL